MEYFLLKPTLPFPMGIPEMVFTKEELEKEETVVKFVKYSRKREEMVFQDYLSTSTIRFQYHIISDRLKQFLVHYLPETNWVPVVLIDTEQQQALYWKFKPKIINALHPDTIYDIGKAIKKLVLNTACIGKERIFSIQTPKQTLLLVRIDVVEGILRREFYGLELLRVEGKEGNRYE